MSGEEKLIAQLVAAFGGTGRAEVGIGDDAAVLAAAEKMIVTTDLLIEGVDFTRAIPLELVAAKSLAVNLSDLAAMGAISRSFVLSIGLPADLVASFSRFAAGLAEAARRWNVSLVGGDLSASRDLTISITAFGELPRGSAALLRSGARPGDSLFLSRPVGAAAAGLHLLQRGWSFVDVGGAVAPKDLPAEAGYAQKEFAGSAMRRHAAPDPEVELGPQLAASGATACIDVSDGLSTDLHRLCRASGCGALVEWARIPRFPDIESLGFSLGIDVARAVLHGGEELALLFTSRRTESELSAGLRRPVYRIGRMTEGTGVVLEKEDRQSELPAAGWDHFTKT
ncbi:MAG TPA: thiamine-phosphate kinase [Thermoanaerobaculia bacterium]|nr:thiamine-phosphate kinase [Thermoanaerobaculia bacterium]